MNSGFLVIDKPAGISSHDVVSRVRRILGTKKVGHTGTLDPFATGVLPIAVNDGTKVIPFLDERVKCYEALMRLGIVTDTLDMTGKVLKESDPASICREIFVESLAGFTGTISQLPPMYSAIKQNGQPLYKLARQGLDVDRKSRNVEIHSIALLSYDLPYASIRVTCSRGTYIRSLSDDIGKVLGCGAALQELRRTASGRFDAGEAITLDELQETASAGCQIFLSPFKVLSHLDDIPLTETGLEKVIHGRSPDWIDTSLREPPVNISADLARLSWKNELAAVAEIVPDKNCGARILLKRVFN